MSPASSGMTARPASRASKPSSSASQPPSSSISARPPPSSGPSSVSLRPGSQVSQRPILRPAQQSSRLLFLCQTLVSQITGLTPEIDAESFRSAVEFVSNNLEQAAKATESVDLTVADRLISGVSQKAQANSHDDLALALEIAYEKLKDQVPKHSDFSQGIKVSHLPDHLQLLIALSVQPSETTLTYAEVYVDDWRNPPKPPPPLTWKDILEEEPFEGQHWEGVRGLPEGSTVEGWELQSDESNDSLSPLDDYDFNDTSSSVGSEELNAVESPPTVPVDPEAEERREQELHKLLDEVQATQRWRSDLRSVVPPRRHFDIGDPSTLGPSLKRIFGGPLLAMIDGPEKEKYIREQDAVREVLIALQGRKNILLQWSDEVSAFVHAPKLPLLLHLTPISLASILATFGRIATFVEQLRRFVDAVFTGSWAPLVMPQTPSDVAREPGYRTRTLEAFAEAVEHEIQRFQGWCADQEEKICHAIAEVGPQLIVSLLGFEKAIHDAFSRSFAVLVNIIESVLGHVFSSHEAVVKIWALSDLPGRIHPATITAILLDLLFNAVQEHLSMGDNVTADSLMRVFAKTAEPVWSMVGRWLKNGMPAHDSVSSGGSHDFGSLALDREFFVEDNELPLLDPDFWKGGFTLRGYINEEDRPKTVPVFLVHVVEHVLGSGKAVGLLRALGIQPLLEDGRVWLSEWRSFTSLIAAETHNELQHHPAETSTEKGTLFSVSADTLSRIVYDELLPHYQTISERLTKVFVDDCSLWIHLAAIEDLFLMRRGDALSHYADVLFAKMDNNQSWNDFHFLNTAFSDVLAAMSTEWVEPSLVRFSYRGSKDKAINRTVEAIDGLFMEYAVPFPLTYIFGPRILQVYNSVFVFLLQIRRAKSVLERILARGSITSSTRLGSDLKALYATRSKLSWFTNTLLNFLTTYVIHTQLLRFHVALREAKSLDEMIQLHDEHVEKIQGRCLLNPKTSSLHKAIISILDICLHFSACFVGCAGDTTLDISRQSIKMKRHRSRRQRRQSRNVIGFSQSLLSQDSSEEDESDLEGEMQPLEPSFDATTHGEESLFDRLDKMSSDLDGLVRFVRRGVESFAGGTGNAAPAFGVLAFALEDWDL